MVGSPEDSSGQQGSAQPSENSHALPIRSMLKNASMLSLSIAITIPLGLIPKILVPRYLGSEASGILFFGETFPMLILPFMSLGIPDYISKNIPSRPDHAHEIFDSVVKFASIAGLLLLGVIAAYMVIMGHDQRTIGITIITAATQYFTLLCLNIYQPFFVALSHIRFTSLLNVISRTINAMIILPLLIGGFGITWIAAGGLIAQVATLAIWRRQAKAIRMVGAGFNPLLLKGILSSSLLYFASGLMGKINGSIDSALLERFTSFEEIGLYAASARISSVFMLFIPLLGQAFFPDMNRLFASDRNGYRGMMQRSLRMILAMTLPLAVFFTGFGRDAVVMVFGKDFVAAGQMVMSFGPNLVVSYLAVFLGFHSFCTSTGRVVATVVGIGCVVNLLGDFLFIRLGYQMLGHGGGGTGAAAATLLTQSIECMLFLRLSKIKFVDRSLMAKMAFSLLPCGLLVALDSAWYGLPMVQRIFIYLAFVPVYLFIVGLVNSQDIKYLMGILRRFKGSTP